MYIHDIDYTFSSVCVCTRWKSRASPFSWHQKVCQWRSLLFFPPASVTHFLFRNPLCRKTKQVFLGSQPGQHSSFPGSQVIAPNENSCNFPK